MEMHQLKYFVAAAETGSFSRAAEKCNVSQPSLSQQIIKLEGEIGQPLFDRAGRRVLLTEAGRLLVEHARAALMTLENAARQLNGLRTEVRGRLSVGVIPTIAPHLLPAVVRDFLAAFPGVELTIQEDYTERLLAGLCEGNLDVAIAAAPISGERLTFEVLGSDPLLLALPKAHRLARARRVSWESVKQEAFVLINEMHCLGEQIHGLCRGQGFQPRVVCRSSQIATVQELVELGQGVSLLPQMACKPGGEAGVVYRKIDGADLSRTVVAVRHTQRYELPQARQFISTVKSHLQ
jgi:LysR family transcriptional regulator, hydrogen peroxide-inducible genes activator